MARSLDLLMRPHAGFYCDRNSDDGCVATPLVAAIVPDDVVDVVAVDILLRNQFCLFKIDKNE